MALRKTTLALAFFCGLGGCAGGSTRSPSKLAGNWSEIFESRVGCRDSTSILVDGTVVRASGTDCDGKYSYVFSDVSYDGKHLNLTVDVPGADHHVRYRFRWLTDNDLAGDADVTTGGVTKTYPVRWSRKK